MPKAICVSSPVPLKAKSRLMDMVSISGLILAACTQTQPQAEELTQIRQEVAELRTEVKNLAEEIRHSHDGVGVSAPADRNRRNPFGVPDVPDPDGLDVKQFAATVDYLGGASDANAEQWVTTTTKAEGDSIDGEWLGRWKGSGGTWVPAYTATVKSISDRVYILYRDHQGRFLADLHREKNLLVGRLVGVENPRDSNPCVIQIVKAPVIGSRAPCRKKCVLPIRHQGAEILIGTDVRTRPEHLSALQRLRACSLPLRLRNAIKLR